MESMMEVFPDKKAIILIETTKNELDGIIKSMEAVIDLITINEGFPHVSNISKLINALKCKEKE